MIKVINILSDSNIGGAGRSIINYLRYCDRSRFIVKVILPRDGLLVPEVRALDIPVIEVDGIADRSFSPKALAALCKILEHEKPDIVHTHGSLSGRIAAKFAGSRIVYTRHSAFPVSPRLKKGPLHWLNGAVNGYFADAVIAVSPAALENLTDSGISKKKITIIGNGVRPVIPVSPEEQAALRREWDIPERTFLAGYPARLEDYKGHNLLLEAALALKNEGRDFRILIAGRGAQEAAIRSRIEKMGLSTHVKLLGFVENMAGFLSLLDLQLNCSTQSEACSLSIIEGMSMGLPTLASRCSGNPWLVEDGVTGLLFENQSAQDLADKLRHLMDDPAMTSSMGRNALDAYNHRFTGEIFAKNIELLYLTITDRK